MNVFSLLPLRPRLSGSASAALFRIRRVRGVQGAPTLIPERIILDGAPESSSLTEHLGPTEPSPVAKLPKRKRNDGVRTYGTLPWTGPLGPRGPMKGCWNNPPYPGSSSMDGRSLSGRSGPEDEVTDGLMRIIQSWTNDRVRAKRLRNVLRTRVKDVRRSSCVRGDPSRMRHDPQRTTTRVKGRNEDHRNPHSGSRSKLFSDPGDIAVTPFVCRVPILRSSPPVTRDSGPESRLLHHPSSPNHQTTVRTAPSPQSRDSGPRHDSTVTLQKFPDHFKIRPSRSPFL